MCSFIIAVGFWGQKNKLVYSQLAINQPVFIESQIQACSWAWPSAAPAYSKLLVVSKLIKATILLVICQLEKHHLETLLLLGLPNWVSKWGCLNKIVSMMELQWRRIPQWLNETASMIQHQSTCILEDSAVRLPAPPHRTAPTET